MNYVKAAHSHPL